MIDKDAIIERLTKERDEALGRVDELESHGETVAAEFEGDCWKAMRSLLNECSFDWRGLDEDGVQADEARVWISETIENIEGDTKSAIDRAETAEAQLQRLTASLEDEREACALVADAVASAVIATPHSFDIDAGGLRAARSIAAAIRSRKEKAS